MLVQSQITDYLKSNEQSSLAGNKEMHSESSTFMKTLQSKQKDIKNFSNWSAKEQMVVVGAAGMIFGATLPVLAVTLPVAITGVVVALTLFFTMKTIEYAFKGLKWSAEKTVEGAKYTAGKIKDGAVYAKDKVNEGYEHSIDSLRKGSSVVGEGVASKFYKASGETDYIDKIKRFASEEIKKSDVIRDDLKEIFADKGNNSGLVKNILSRISSEIDLKIASMRERIAKLEIKKELTDNLVEKGLSNSKITSIQERISKCGVQKEFIDNLNKKSLHSLLTQRSLPKGSYFIDSIFSEHYDEIKKVITECRESHLYLSVSNIFDRAEKKADRPSLKKLTRSVSSSFSSLRRKDSEQSNGLSRNSSMDSVRTESTTDSEAELLHPTNHKEVKTPISFKDMMPSWFGGRKKSEKAVEVQYQVLSDSESTSAQQRATIGNSSCYVAPEKPPRGNSMGPVSALPALPRSAFDLNGLNFSKDVLTRSNSVDNLASSSSYQSTTGELSGSGNDIVSERGSLSGSDSGRGLSDSFASTRLILSDDYLKKARSKLRKTGSLDRLVDQPATRMGDADVLQQATQTAVKI